MISLIACYLHLYLYWTYNFGNGVGLINRLTISFIVTAYVFFKERISGPLCIVLNVETKYFPEQSFVQNVVLNLHLELSSALDVEKNYNSLNN